MPINDVIDNVWAHEQFGPAFLDALAAHIVVLNEAGSIVAVNVAWTRFAVENGHLPAPSTGIGLNYLELASPEAGPYGQEGAKACRGIQAVLDGSLPEFTLEYPYPSPAKQRWFLLQATPLAARPAGAVVLSHLELTSRNQVEAGLWEHEKYLSELALHIRQVLWMSDADETKILYVNASYEKTWGRSRQSLFDNPRSFFDAIQPPEGEQGAHPRTKAHPEGWLVETYRILRPDGSLRWIWDRGYAVRDEHGQIKRFVGIAEDITDRKAAEADQARLAAIVECSADAIVSATTDGIVVNWNHGAELLYGYSAEEMIGRPVSIVFPPEHYQEYLQVMGRVKKGERIPAYDTKRRRKDGTVITVSVDLCPIEIRDEAIVGISKIDRDITRIKQLEEQFRQAQKMEAVGRLAGGVAHDFNNLLTIINGYSEIMLERLPDGDPIRDLVREVLTAGGRAAGLTRQLLAFSRKTILEPKILDLNVVVAGVDNMLRRIIGEDVQMAVVADAAAGTVKADPGQIEQVILNLVVNARDAMPQGGHITIEVHNAELDNAYVQEHAEAQPGSHVLLTVSDNGCGMDRATRARIFEPFFSTKGEQGTGLGLATVYGIVKQSGGHVAVYSEVGHGTTFKVYLPRVEEQPTEPSKPRPSFATMPRGDELLLLVEDEDGVRALVRHVLQNCGYTVLEARDGEDALRVAGQHIGQIDLLITDVVMPRLSGRALAERVIEQDPGVKVLYLSGYTEDSVVRHGILRAEVDFLQKPFVAGALAQKVREVLDKEMVSNTATS